MNYKHLIFGAGLIGGHLASSLMFGGQRVSIIGRQSAFDKMDNGVVLTDYLNQKATTLKPEIFNNESQAGELVDILWLTVKCTAIDSSIEQIKQIVSDETIIICCQNGLDSDLPLRRALPNQTILTALVGYNIIELQAGHFHRSTEGKFMIEDSDVTDDIIKASSNNMLPLFKAKDIKAEQLAKLQLNLANPVNALANIPVKEMMENPQFRKIISSLMAELLKVTDAKKISLPKLTALPAKILPHVMKLPNFIYLVIAQKTIAIDPNARLSMWWDITNKRETEIDYINGALVKEGELLGVDCSINRRLCDLIKQVEAGKLSIGLTAEELSELLA